MTDQTAQNMKRSANRWALRLNQKVGAYTHDKRGHVIAHFVPSGDRINLGWARNAAEIAEMLNRGNEAE